MSQKCTVEVPVEVFGDAVPEWYWSETVPVYISAHSDSLYVDFPSFDSIEHRVQSLLDNDSEVRGDGPEYPLNTATITTVEQARMRVIPRQCNGQGLPTRGDGEVKTTQYRMAASSIFRATVRYKREPWADSGEIQPITRELQENMFDTMVTIHRNSHSDDYAEWDLPEDQFLRGFMNSERDRK